MTVTTRLERRDSALYIVAEWDDVDDGVYPAGPRRLAIEVAAEVMGGITPDMLRRAQRHLADMTDEFNDMPSTGGRSVMVRRYIEGRLAELPADEGYHGALLALLDDLGHRGLMEPEKALATAMGVPEETLAASLHVARQRVLPAHIQRSSSFLENPPS